MNLRFGKIVIILLLLPFISFGKGIRIDPFANDNRCLTFQIHSKKNKIQKKINIDELTQRPKNQKFIQSPSGNFCIHYDSSGKHSVSPVDNNSNGIPDYVDSIAFYSDFVFQKTVNEMGFPSPIGDSLRGGSDAFDIYLFDLGDSDLEPNPNDPESWGGVYGYTVGELLINPQKKFDRYTTYMVIDNDFSSKDSTRIPGDKSYQAYKTFGVLGAKITLAHEFQHAIQFRYGLDDLFSSGFSEMCSVMFENLIFPESKDYLQYTKSLFKFAELYNFAVPTPENGYRYSIFAEMLVQKYGIDIIKKMWELMSDGITTYKCIDSALVLQNSSLDAEWMSFMEWIFYTSNRSIEGKYFKNAQEMPLFPFTQILEYNEPSVVLSGSLDPYQMRIDQVTFINEFPLSNDTLRLLTSHFNTEAIIYGNYGSENFSQNIISEFQTDYSRLFPNSPIAYYYHLTSAHNHIQSKLLEVQGVETIARQSAYPNPFKVGKNTTLFFPAPETALIGEVMELVIYNDNLYEIYRKKHPVGVNNAERVLVLNFEELQNSSDISTGIYIFKAGTENKQLLGKFAIIR